MFRNLLRLASIAIPLFAGTALHSQTQGEISGEITDSSGAVMPRVTVTVRNENTNAVRNALTNATGVYDMPSLLPGSYSITAEAQGYQKMVRTGIVLQVQQAVRADFHMMVGEVSQTIAVTTAEPLIDMQDATVGTVIGTQRIADMPLNGRNFLQLVSLSPNVVYGFAPAGQQVSIQGGQRAATTISIAGQRSEFNHYTLDGLEDTDDNFNDYLLLPSVDALQEFKVQYGIYSAEYGRNVGQINVSSKSGSNAYHGTLWDFVRNSAMDADNYGFTAGVPLKSPLSRNQFGFELGGPVRIPKLFNGKDRLFFMTNYEGQRWYTSLQEVATVPSLAMRGQAPGVSYADFSSNSNPIYDPATRKTVGGVLTAQQFPNNQIPMNRFDADAVKLLKFYPAPNVPGATINNYQNLNSQVQNSDQFTVRIDLTESAKSTWFGRYSWSSEFNLNPSTFPDQGTVLSTLVHQTAIGNTRVLTPTITNELLGGYSGFANILVTQGAYGENVVGELGGFPGMAAPTPINYGIPAIAPTSYAGFGDSGTAPNISHDHYFQGSDNVSIIRGKHTIQFGASIQHTQYNQEGNQGVTGGFGFSGAATNNPQSVSNTGNGFADYILGLVNTSSGPSTPLAVSQLRATDQYYYGMDTWKIRPNLTITPGLRYEKVPPFWSKHDELINVQLNSLPLTNDFSTYNPALPPVIVRQGTANNFYQGIPFTFTPAPGVQVAQDGRLGKYLVNEDKTMFAPRLGLAYSPFTNWAIRSGIGLFYAQDSGNNIYDMSRNLSAKLNVTSSNTIPNLTLENPFGVAPGSNPLSVNASSVLFLNYWVTRRNPYEIQYELNVQHQLTRTTALEMGYNGAEGHHLDRFHTLNAALPKAGTPANNRPDPAMGLLQYTEDFVNSTYNALAVKYTQRTSHGLDALVGYTYSRSIDTGSATRSHGGDADDSQNPYDKTAGERGPSIFNQTHRLTTSLLYEPPIGRGKAFLNHGIASAILGNWQFNEIFVLGTGTPFTFGYTANILNGGGGGTGGAGGRPNYSGVTLAPSGGKNRQHWFNTAGYVNPPQYSFGNVSRNSMYGPGALSWDSSLMKNFHVYREQGLQFRFEAFNAANHPNFGLPNASLGNPAFSQISTLASGTSMREFQLSVKYNF